jgi:dipeptidyl aminopeptidase/acylaminoacyl peptidase
MRKEIGSARFFTLASSVPTRRLSFVALAMLAISSVARTGQSHPPFTIEQVLSAPFPYELIAAPSGARVAWVQNDRGVRNVWSAEAPEYRGRPVTAYREDDGQELSSLGFSPDGRAIVYVRGGPPNREGEIPNPRSDPQGADRAIWIAAVASGEPRCLADGAAPAVSPTGKLVAFVRGGQIWSVPLDGSSAPRQMLRARGRATMLRWSPDGSRLAFVSHRGDHAWIAVYDLTDRSLRYLAPSVDVDAHPVWSPDGQRIAFIRTPQERRNVRFVLRRSGLPWSVLVADPRTGLGQTVWKAKEGSGSVFVEVAAANQIFWGASNRLVFPWERDGWLHLYSVPADAGKETLLTPGDFEVEHVSLSPDGRHVVFSSNQGDSDRRHLWRVSVTGGPPVAITSGSGIEWSPVMTADGRAVACLASDARRPAHPAVILESQPPRPLAGNAIPDSFPLGGLVEPQPVIFSSADGRRLHGQLFLPQPTRADARSPAMVYVHGGPRRQMLLGWHYLETYHKAYALNQYLASRGYVVLAVNFRSGTGYGLEFREALDLGARGSSEFSDVLGGAAYLRTRRDVAPDRIGIWGGSYGGYLAALALARASDLFRAGVSLNGVHDWNVELRSDDPGFENAFQSSFDPATRAELERLARRSSPIGHLETWRSPVLLIHGDDDRSGPFRQTVELTHALRHRGVEVETLVFPDEEHTFLLHSTWLAAYKATADFFERRLKH